MRYQPIVIGPVVSTHRLTFRRRFGSSLLLWGRIVRLSVLRVLAGAPDRPLVIDIEIPCYGLDGKKRVLNYPGVTSVVLRKLGYGECPDSWGVVA